MDTRFGRPRFLIYALPFLLIIIMGTAAGAQGFSPFALPGGLFGQGARGQYLSNYGCSGDPGAGLSMVIGYASDCGRTKFILDGHTVGIGGVVSRLYDYRPMSALYLAADLPMELGSMGKVILSGSLTIPTTNSIDENDFALQGLVAPFGGSGWNTKTMWGTLQGLYVCPAYGCRALAGFRWDNWQTSLNGRFDISPGFAVAAPTDTGALTINAYVPLVGVATYLRGLTMGMVGFPWVPGDFRYAETRNNAGLRFDSGSGNFKRAWFVEFFTDYRLPMSTLVSLPGAADANLSLFGKFNYMEVKNSFTLTRQPAAVSDVFDFAFYRTLFVVGAQANLNFNMPNVRGWF